MSTTKRLSDKDVAQIKFRRNNCYEPYEIGTYNNY